jgi:hypothetical protein
MVERTELLTPEPAEALGALLDVPVPDLEREGPHRLARAGAACGPAGCPSSTGTLSRA